MKLFQRRDSIPNIDRNQIKVLFLIHDLGQGGAEKVLVNLVNHMDHKKFDISVIALFGGGVNEQFLSSEVHYRTVFPKMIPGNSKLMKLLSPKLLHRWFIKDKYDIEISYLEGPSARIISGCPDDDTKLVTWIHCTMNSKKGVAESFRTIAEAEKCYNNLDEIVFVSDGVRNGFIKHCQYTGSTKILYNTVESDRIIEMSKERADEIIKDRINLIAMGTLKPVKGFDRLLRVVKKLHGEDYPVHLYILGIGPQQKELENFIKANSLENIVTLLGYKTNPYKYLEKSSLFVCSSFSEGFSTAVTEALIVGTPVCTVEVSGMKEILGKNNEFGVVTENTEEALYQGIKHLISNPELLEEYKNRAKERGKMFKTESTVKSVEEFLQTLAYK